MKSKLMALIALVWMMLPGTASAEYVSNTLPSFGQYLPYMLLMKK